MNTLETTPLAPTLADWNSIQERYLHGDDVRTIAEENGVTANAIYQRAYRNHWKDQQIRHLEKEREEVSREVRGCFVVSVLKEARAFQREEPASNPIERDTFSKARERCFNLAARIFAWEVDPADRAKAVKTLDV